ncbi:MAG: hypothetical protein ACKN9R_06115 [Candidatus Limnocylindrus sp.]
MSRADEAPGTVERLKALAGGKILGATMGDGGFPSVLVRMPDGTEWWIDLQSDPEGNGPGFANVERAVPAGKAR